MDHKEAGLKVGLGMNSSGQIFINLEVLNENLGKSKNIRFLNFIGENNWISYGIRIVYGLLIGLSIVSQGFYSSKKSIQVQKFQTVLYWSLIIAAAPLLFQSNVSTQNLVLLAPTLAIFVTYHFLQFDKQMAEAVHLLSLAIVLALQYHSLLGF